MRQETLARLAAEVTALLEKDGARVSETRAQRLVSLDAPQPVVHGSRPL